MEYTENMHKVGDWVHTQNGVGIITNVLPVYQQYWDEEQELKDRNEGLFKDDPDTEDRIFGKVPKSGEWIKDIITVKRLCDHDLKPLTRTKCFTSLAYANDKITKKEMKEVNRILQDPKIKNRFDNYKCKYEQVRHRWNILIPPEKAVKVKKALDNLEGNDSEAIRMTMHEIEDYFKRIFNIDILHSQVTSRFNNATIHTLTLPENDPEYYNQNREQMFCKILISKQWYEPEYLLKLIKAHNLEAKNYDNKVWDKCGWDGNEIQF